MRKITIFLLLLVFAWSGMVVGQSNAPRLSEQQKIALDQAARQTESQVQPVLVQEVPIVTSTEDNLLTIGTGTTYGAYPAYYMNWCNYWENNRTQTLYLASDLAGPKFINQLAWQFERIAPAGDNSVNNVVIKIKPTSATSLTSGAYADMSGAVTVYSNSGSYVPATATGWAAPLDITDFAYNGADNLIIEVTWGDVGDYASTYYRNMVSVAADNRTICGYADSETPPNYDFTSTSYANIAIYWTPFNPPGNIAGIVADADGVPVANATVGVVDGINVATDATGHYLLSNIFGGEQDIYAMKDGWNTIEATVIVPSGGTLTHNFTLTKPSLTVTPLMFDEILNPNEYLTKFLGMLNIGDGPAGWTAEVLYPETNNSSSNNLVERQAELLSMNPSGSSLLTDVAEGTEGANNRANMTCPEESLFANEPVGSSDANASHLSSGYYGAQQFTGVTDPIGSVTIWAVYVSAGVDPQDFVVDFYADGGTPGALLASYSVPAISAVATGELLLGSYPIIQYTIPIPATEIANGYVSVVSQLGSNWMYWLNTTAGTGSAFVWTGSWTSMPKRAVCLGPAEGGGVSGWLTLGQYEGAVGPNGTSFNLPVNFDATGTEAGQVYNAEIVVTTQPNVGTFNIPVTMTIYGDPLSPVTDLTAVLTNEVTGSVSLAWNFTRPVNFQYFLIKRNGLGIGTTTANTFTNILPDFGNYCYTVTPVYDAGNGVPGGPACVDWFIPSLCWSPATVQNSQWPDVTEQVTLTLENCGDGSLAFEFTDYVDASRFACSNEIELRDSFGDGWNGGTISVFVNGTAVLSGVTLSSGAGPAYFSFPVNGGDLITTDFVPGSWAYECNYKLLDVDRVAYFTSNPAADLLASANVHAPCPVPSYITSVTPASGVIASGEELNVTLTYNSDGFYVGSFAEGLALTTNDPDNLETTVPNIMHVYQPAAISGTVTDCITGAPKKNVTVKAMGTTTYAAETAENGTYSMMVDPGTYDVEFSMVGFHTVVVEDVVVTVAGSPVDVDATLCEMAYPVSFVYADPNEADTQALITWGIPMGPYSIQYDDGTAENYFSWLSAGSASAVKFTPAGYPATVTGGRLFVGDGSFPEGVNFLGAEFAVGVIAADGANGLPGTVLDSAIVTVDNYGWVNFDNALNATVNSGNFYIAVWKLFVQVPVGVDQNVPTYYRSYVKPVGGNWAASSYQDFMIRAIVDGPGTNVANRTSGEMIYPVKPVMTDFMATCAPSGKPGVEGIGQYLPVEAASGSRELVDYAVARIDGFNPEAGESPEDGTMTVIAAHNATQSYNDAGFGGQPAGFYAYAVRANYSVENSTWVYSNVVAHGLDNVVTLNVTRCDGGDVSGAAVRLRTSNYPYQDLTATTDASGVIVFDSVINGTYNLTVTKMGFQAYEHNGIIINYDYTEDVVLANKTYPAKNLMVEPLTSVATWEAPIYTAVELQNFEQDVFPPAGWVKESNSRGFFRTNAGGSSFWPIPAGDGYYACTNDDGFNGDASVDRLILPVSDLREGAAYNFNFDYFFDGSWGGSAFVEYSLDNGANWTVMMTLGAVNDWTTESISLASFAGEDAITLCFHYDDNGMWADGLAIDNVSVSNGPVVILGYEISLNGGYITEVGPEVLTYAYRNLTYGQTYTATVKAKFPCGLSEPANYVFQSSFLYPPVELGDAYVYNTNEIPLMWYPPVAVAGPAMAVVADILANNNVPAARNSSDFSSVATNGGAPDAARETVLNWDGDNADGLGLTSGGDWEVAAYFPADMVDPLAGEGITSVEIFINDLSSSFSLKFYGAGSPTSPGAVLYEQAFTPVMEWNTIELDEPVMLTGEDIWVGYVINGQPAGTYPAGMDGGPAVLGFGDWVLLDGAWDNVGNYGFGNFNIRAHVNPVAGGGGVPDGLLSFNLYQDGEFLTNVPYNGEGTDEFVNYVLNPVDPGTYGFDVSAVYDLSVFGLTGTAESAWEGTDVVTVAWGFPLPFTETFDQGTFDFNNWRFNENAANWTINSQSGNGAPSAEFTWDPLLTDGYSATLTSNPLLGDLITEGNIWLDFDLKLNNRNATGDEKMKVEVFNGSTWSQVAIFDNEEGFDYTSNHINITAGAKGRVFQVRFNAIGENSFDVISWFVDNINIYRVCTPPTSLTGEYVYNGTTDFGAEVCWNGAAGTNVSEWLFYDDGVNVDGIGGPASFSWAVKFDPSQLEDFEGASLTKIKIYNRTDVANELRIYEGTNAATLLHTQTLSGLAVEAWEEVELTSSVTIDITKQLWITVYTDDGANYPAGCGNGMNEPNGDFITLDGSTWEHLSDYSLDFTWNLRGYVTTVTGATVSLPMDAPKDNYNNDARATLAISGLGSSSNATLVETEADRAIAGYNVYRMVEGGSYALLANVPAEQGVTHYCYYDADTDAGVGYYYQVTAAYSSATDACESGPGMALVHPTEDFVYVLVTDINSNESMVTRMYPNPANDNVTIESSKMNRVIVMNTVGQVVFDAEANGATKVTLNTSTFEAGVYVVRIETAEGTATKRVTIVR